jgi:hypothetical protein
MPNDPGPTSWDPLEYQRALQQIEDAGTTEARRLARARTMVRVDPAGAPTVRVPAWDDIIHLGPRIPVTPEDRTIQRHFERAGLPSPLDPKVQAEIARRNELAAHIRNNPVPEYQQGVTAAMTAVDNVQDAALTASVAARVTMPVLGSLGAYLAPAITALGAIGSALNWIAAALFGFGVLYALACRGPRAAAAQASVPALAGFLFKGVSAFLPRSRGINYPIPGKSNKPRFAAMMTGATGGRTPTNTAGSRWARGRPSWPELFQVAQTAYDVTGYGVTLGAVYGFVAESSYAATRAGRGEPVTPRSPRVSHELYRILGPHLEVMGRAALWHREQCARAIASAILILRDPETFGDEFYALTWLTYYVSLEPLMWDTQGISWRETVIDGLDAGWYTWDVRDPVTADALHALGANLDAPARWPVAGSPYVLTADQMVSEIAPEIARALQRWLEAAPMDPLRRFVSELAVRVTERVWYFLEASPYVPGWELATDTAIWESFIQADRWPVISDDPNAIMAAIHACQRYIEDTGHKYIDVETLDAIWERAGSPLLRIRGDGPSQPVEHLLPWDPETGAPDQIAFGSDTAQARERLRALLEDSQPPDARRPAR